MLSAILRPRQCLRASEMVFFLELMKTSSPLDNVFAQG